MEPDAPAEIFGDWQAAEYMSAVLDKLRPTRPVNVPDLPALIHAAAEDGLDICAYCQSYGCNACIVNTWKNERSNEE